MAKFSRQLSASSFVVFLSFRSAFIRSDGHSLDVMSRPAISRHKTSLFVFIIISLVVICVLPPRSTPPGKWMRHFLTSVHGTVADAFKDKYATAYNLVSSSNGINENGSAITDLITAPPEDTKVNKKGRYVSMCNGNFDNRRIGNQLSNFAAMLHVARLTGRRVAMVRRHPHGWLDRWFRVPVTRVDRIDAELCPCVGVGEHGGLNYNRQILMLSNRTDIVGKSLLVCGWFQSWKYTVGVESALRHHLRLLPNVSAAVHNYLDEIQPSVWKGKSFSRIGIHVRAGDVMRRDKWNFGYTIPQRPYFEQAMTRFVNEQQGHGGHVQFIVTSDSLAWVKKAINFTSIAHQLNLTSSSTEDKVLVDVAHSEGHDAGFDLALLSLCDGVIMSTGTYGWWGAWLANKTTIYYSNWPRAGTPLFGQFNRGDFFPSNWIPIGGPAFPCCSV